MVNGTPPFICDRLACLSVTFLIVVASSFTCSAPARIAAYVLKPPGRGRGRVLTAREFVPRAMPANDILFSFPSCS
jgi:hypothetical protein